MKLEVGMYVRTKDGVITKIEQIVDDEIHFKIDRQIGRMSRGE